jgi:ferric-dicitrate binding protein FerR (iron transport regulator)
MSLKNPSSHIQKLARKWQENTITEEEKLLFNTWYDSFDDDTLEDVTSENREDLKARMYSAILEKEEISVQTTRSYKWRYLSAVAALVLLFLSFGGYFYLRNAEPVHQEQSVKSKAIDIAPGESKAVLTLADGSEIVLNSAKNGVLATQGNISVSKNKEGQVVYQNVGNASQKEGKYNTISTPRGGQYQVDLPDGTRVWLNAASTLKFPLAFNHNERRVELQGEAYFEVNPKHFSGSKSRKIPFIVKSGKQEVEVLGTHFNVNAYPDENDIKTTLLEGSVRVMHLASHTSKLLKPGQQSSVDGTITVSDVDALQAIEWQKGYFSFENESVESIMRKISRWYNVEIEYQENIRHRKFAGRISKFENVSQILKIMEKTKVIHFKIEEGRITVMP